MKDPIIKKVANGYYVIPYKPHQDSIDDEEVYVFKSMSALVDKLKEWLNENKEASHDKSNR